jgi:hypothetical protein
MIDRAGVRCRHPGRVVRELSLILRFYVPVTLYDAHCRCPA